MIPGTQKVVTRAPLGQPSSDRAYWLSRTVQERLAAVEILRQQMWPSDAEPRLQIVGLLNSVGVEYLVVGGYALAAFGHPRYTGDIDLWINPTENNAQRLVQALDQFGFGGLGLKPTDFVRPESVVQLGYPPARIDLLTSLDGVEFAPCYLRRTTVALDGIDLPIINVEDFRINKRVVGRARDLADLESLDEPPDSPA